MEQTQRRLMVRVRALPFKVVKALIALTKQGYRQLKSRYGPRHTKVLVAAVFFTLFVPVPGISLLAVVLVVAVAEVHREIIRREGLRKISAKELVMSMNCDVVLQGNATPAELTNVGAALWRWFNHAAGATRVYQYLNNQALADLIAGRLPVSSQMKLGKVHVKFRDEGSQDRQATIDSLRREIPARGVADILVEGKSWTPIDRMHS